MTGKLKWWSLARHNGSTFTSHFLLRLILINRLLQLRQLYKRIIQHDTALNPCQIRELARTAPRSKLETWLHLIVEYKYTKMFWPTVSVTVSCPKQLTPACWLLPCQHFYLYHQVIIVTLTVSWPGNYLSLSHSEQQGRPRLLTLNWSKSQNCISI